MLFLEDTFDEELGAAPKKAKKKKKVGKAFKAIATGGMSLAAKSKIGKKVAKSKVGKALKAVATGGVSLAVSATKKKLAKTKVGKLASSIMPHAKLPPKKAKASATVAAVKATTVGQCSCKNDMAQLVAAKLIAELGPPLTAANRALKKLEIQRQATYEHKKLMTDGEFRKKVLQFIAQKANGGNKSAKRTISCLRG